MNCTHYMCRCARAVELAAMGLTLQAIEAHGQEVRCRMGEPSLFQVSKVEMLKLIMAKVPDVLDGRVVGGTGYLDDRVTPTASVMKGSDPHGRVFITLCMKSTERDEHGGREQVRVGIVTLFQRYSDDTNIITQANNSHPSVCFIGGAASEQDLTRLQELVTTGKVLHQDEVGRCEYELVSPEQALRARRS